MCEKKLAGEEETRPGVTQGRSKLQGSVRKDKMMNLLLGPRGPGWLGRQEGNSASMGDNASEPWAGAGTWGPE